MVTVSIAWIVDAGGAPAIHFFSTFLIAGLQTNKQNNENLSHKYTTRKKLGYSVLDCLLWVVPMHCMVSGGTQRIKCNVFVIQRCANGLERFTIR